MVISAHMRELRDTRIRIAIPGFSESTGPLELKRGIRQGSAISPLLWAIGLDEAMTVVNAKWKLRGAGFKFRDLGDQRFPNTEAGHGE
eukprot:11109347-Alexandrium_andersonii.AAC.1